MPLRILAEKLVLLLLSAARALVVGRRKLELWIRRIKIPVPFGEPQIIIIHDDYLMAHVLSDGNGLSANKLLIRIRIVVVKHVEWCDFGVQKGHISFAPTVTALAVQPCQ